MRTASLARYHPKLQGIFGPLDQGQQEYLWKVLAQSDHELARIARHFGRTGSELEMMWTETGQLSIGGDVETGDPESHAANFAVRLWPSWMHEEPGRRSEWIIYIDIDVDCQHVPDHESMDTVFSREVRRPTPEAAIDELLAATKELAALAIKHPIEYWTSMGRS